MKRRVPGIRSARGFTLVELLTVVAILSILVMLSVGAIQGARNHMARKATLKLFAALDAALQQYYGDWGRYPWDLALSTANRDYDQVLVSEVAGTTTTYPFLPLQGMDAVITYLPKDQEKRDAMFYAAMTMTRRSGPYFRGGATAARSRKTSDGKVYFVFVDGWGRKVTYTSPNTATMQGAPLLRSLGADEFDSVVDPIKNDDLYNYKAP
jgi:general secretion pathway protein G